MKRLLKVETDKIKDQVKLNSLELFPHKELVSVLKNILNHIQSRYSYLPAFTIKFHNNIPIESSLSDPYLLSEIRNTLGTYTHLKLNLLSIELG